MTTTPEPPVPTPDETEDETRHEDHDEGAEAAPWSDGQPQLDDVPREPGAS